MPNYLDTSLNTTQAGVWMGPATVVLADLADVESDLRPRDTLSSKKGWSEQGYDFPNTYVDLPIRVVECNPESTYAVSQNVRFAQRYLTK